MCPASDEPTPQNGGVNLRRLGRATAVAAGAAITFWLTDSPKAKPAQQAGIGFSCVPALAGVACHGRF